MGVGKTMAAIGAALGVGAALGAMGGSSSSSGGSSGGGGVPPSGPEQQGYARIRELGVLAGLAPAYRDFLVFCAYGESRGNNLVGLGIPARYPPWTKTHADWLAKGKPAPSTAQSNEAKAARTGYNNNKAWLAGCWPEDFYTFGSGGWFGLLPSSGLAVFRNTALACQHPWSIFDPATSVIMAMGFIRRLRGWSQFKANPTMLALRVGWGAPSKMNDSAWLTERRQRYRTHASALGLPVSFLDQVPPALPAFDPVALMGKLGGKVWLPGKDVA